MSMNQSKKFNRLDFLICSTYVLVEAHVLAVAPEGCRGMEARHGKAGELMNISITLSALLAQCAPEVAPSTLAAIVSVESGGNAFAIGVNKGVQVRQPTTAAEAVAIAKGLLARGANIDLGLGQINSSNLRWLGLSVEAAFDPCQNLAAAARVLTHNYRRAVSLGHSTPLGAALSAYNTGSMLRGYRNGYVAKVYRASGTRLLASPAPMIAALPLMQPAIQPPVQPIGVLEASAAVGVPADFVTVDAVTVDAVAAPASPPAPPAWDVFARASAANVFPKDQRE